MTEPRRMAIIDIGSNSVRLVVYGGALRAPSVIFNEKVMAGLGRALRDTGALDDEAIEASLKALRRFQQLVTVMDVPECRIVATAAVREASNGKAFLKQISDLGLKVDVLSGDEEAVAAGYGVISAFPLANGIVGDLGGGSLELVRIKDGAVGERVSLPLGVLRLSEIRAKGPFALEQHVRKLIAASGWNGGEKGLPFYMVGGSWRALVRLHIHQTKYPLTVLSGYTLGAAGATQLQNMVSQLDKAELKQIPTLTSARAPMLDDAAALLTAVAKELKPSQFIASAFGLREGLLFSRLTPERRREDPLIVGARGEGARLGRFPEHGDQLHNWISPIFADDLAADARVRHAACLLADVAWSVNPDYRAARGLEVALEGSWIDLDARGRAMIAQALFTSFGGAGVGPKPLSSLAAPDDLSRARCWGLAIRLGQRLGGGAEDPSDHARLSLKPETVRLAMQQGYADLAGEAVERRLKQLATAMGRVPKLSLE